MKKLLGFTTLLIISLYYKTRGKLNNFSVVKDKERDRKLLAVII